MDEHEARIARSLEFTVANSDKRLAHLTYKDILNVPHLNLRAGTLLGIRAPPNTRLGQYLAGLSCH